MKMERVNAAVVADIAHRFLLPHVEARELPALASVPDVGAWFAWAPPPGATFDRVPRDRFAMATLDGWVKAWLELAAHVRAAPEAFTSCPIAVAATVGVWQQWLEEAGLVAQRLAQQWVGTAAAAPPADVPLRFTYMAQELPKTVALLARAAAGAPSDTEGRRRFIVDSCIVSALDAVLNAPLFAVSRSVGGIGSGMNTLKPSLAGEAQLLVLAHCRGQPTVFQTLGAAPASSFEQQQLESQDALAELALLAAGGSTAKLQATDLARAGLVIPDGGSDGDFADVMLLRQPPASASSASASQSDFARIITAVRSIQPALPLSVCVLACWFTEPFNEVLRRDMFAVVAPEDS